MTTPSIEEVVDASRPDVLRFKERGGLAYCRAARTSCGHDWITLRAWKSDGSWQTEHHGQKVHCVDCGLLQSFGPATPGRRTRRRDALGDRLVAECESLRRETHALVRAARRLTEESTGMSPLSDHDDEPYGGGV